MKTLMLRGLMMGLVAIGITACEGDTRPFAEAYEVSELNLVSIHISVPESVQSPLYLNSGQTIQLGVKGLNVAEVETELSASNRQWRVSDTTIATIDDNGRLTAKANGSVDVFVELGGVQSAAFPLTVSDATLNAIEQIVGHATGKRCLPEEYYAIGRFSDDTLRTLDNVSWGLLSATSNNAVVIRNPNASASVTGFHAGTYQLIATQDAIKSDSFSLEIMDSLRAINILPNPAVVEVGTPLYLTATGIYDEQATDEQEATIVEKFITEHVKWVLATAGTSASVSDTLGSRGLLTGTVAGSETVTANCGSFQGIRSVTVNDTDDTSATAEAISFNQDDPLVLSRAGSESVQLQVSTGSTYDSDNDIAFSDLTFSVSGTSQGTVAISLGDNDSDAAGLIRPQVETGTAVVTVTQISTGVSTTLTVNVGSS